MTVFEYVISALFSAIGVVGAIVLPQYWQRAISVLVLLGMTVFAGHHGFKLIA